MQPTENNSKENHYQPSQQYQNIRNTRDESNQYQQQQQFATQQNLMYENQNIARQHAETKRMEENVI